MTCTTGSEIYSQAPNCYTIPPPSVQPSGVSLVYSRKITTMYLKDMIMMHQRKMINSQTAPGKKAIISHGITTMSLSTKCIYKVCHKAVVKQTETI